jgi:MFS family permease
MLYSRHVFRYYTGPLIRSAGIKDEHTIIWLSLGTSFVNFFGTVLPFFVIERYGRRTVLLVSTALTIVALILLGSSFLALNLDTNPTIGAAEMQHLIGFDAAMDPKAEALEHCLSKT